MTGAGSVVVGGRGAGPVVRRFTGPGRASSGAAWHGGGMVEVILAVVPSAAVSALFFIVIRAILHADSTERLAFERADAAARVTPGPEA